MAVDTDPAGVEAVGALSSERAVGGLGARTRRRHPDWLLRAALALLVLCLLVDQGRALLSFSRHYTEQDQTLLWLAGRDLLHLHIHTPNFYGQNYDTTFEAIPGAIFHSLGLSLGFATPFGTTLIATICWLALAGAAWWRRQYFAAAAALAFPVCMSTAYLLLFDAPRGVLSGDLMAALTVVAAVAVRRPWLRLALILAGGGLAYLWDSATVLAVLPAAAASIVGDVKGLLSRPRWTLGALGAGAAIPVAWWVLQREWYRAHPADLTAHLLRIQFQRNVLQSNLHHLGRLIAFYEPELWHRGGLLVAVFLIVLAVGAMVSIVSGRPEPATAALVLLVTTFITLSVRDTLNFRPGIYLSAERFLLPLPIGLWSVIYFTEGAYREHRRRDHRQPRAATFSAGILVVVVVALASTVTSQVRFGANTGKLAAIDKTAAVGVPTVDPSVLVNTCESLTSLYRHSGAEWLVTDDRDIAYGCAAQTGINTLDQNYDRRGWILEEAAVRPVTHILMDGSTCDTSLRDVGRCTPQPDGTVLLTTPPRSAGLSLFLAGLAVHGLPRAG
jgi:hypothetical protein